MSRVKIKDIYYDGEIDDSSEKVKNIEVVPRKIVEIIIEKCADHTSVSYPSDYIMGVLNEADWIAKYAESLLKQFEEEN